ncbi:MAG: phosphoglucosamine mutase [Bdellovibrionales bacterium]|nr:phosphoglucosamine mutase [Bdellovibrionales bacterium]
MNLKNKRLFGTDGIRGKANSFPVTPNIILRVGQALACLLKKKYPQEKQHNVLIGKDTRLSGYMLEQALASGLNSMGVFVQLTGPLPTPGIGFLAQNMRVSAGVVISASHNPYYDNGIKIFFKDGFKISGQEEQEIEKMVFSEKNLSHVQELGRTRRIVDAIGRYIVFAKSVFPKQYNLKGLKIVLDCANGAAYKVAPAIFSELGAEMILLGNKPTGFNINEKSGALYPKKIAQKVLQEKAHLGLSLDGDADRLIMSDEKGRILNGDHILGICSLYLNTQNKLNNKQVVSTHISNTGLEKSLAPYGISFLKTNIGDKNVVEKMKQNKITLGGEPSGHIIFLNYNTTGDACIAALNVLAFMKKTGKKLSALRDLIKEYPQICLNVKIKKKRSLDLIPGYKDLLKSVKKDLSKQDRFLIRYSGTEKFVRIFFEGKKKKQIQAQAKKIQSFLEKHLS